IVDFDPGVGIVNIGNVSSGLSDIDGFVQKWSQCNTTFQTDIQTACISYTWINGVTYTSSNNSATQTLTNSAGCDSVVTLNLTINNSNTGTDVQTACNSYTWIDGNAYTASNNTATDTLTNSVGCDSVVTLNLTINNSNTGTDVQTACISYTWINGITYYSSNNIATQTLTNAAGCDSVVTLNLTINNSNTGIDVQTACNSYTWIDGVTYTSSNNTATDTLTNSAGCDSVVTLNLTITNSSSATDVVSSCNSYTWINGITYTSSNNTATQTLTNAAGCDSIVTLNLTITNSPLISQPINQTVNIGNNAQFQFLTSGTLLNYQWQMDVGIGYVNLSNAGQFSGADTNLLTVSNVNMANNNTNFRCIITESSTCKDTTNSVKLFVSSGTSIIEQTNSLVNLYPNPTSDFVTINLANKSKGQVIVLDLLGKVVLNKEFNSNQIQLSLKSIESKGTYLVKIMDSNGNVIANKKLIYQ
ncbi:T9SS type A sorting domain-containing protein, partial [Flavobacteriales bacterium]|nr:T9SS type A sorting domain-containing protein [Flavobacteriales bacterium]